jgi:hypothetical protein
LVGGAHGCEQEGGQGGGEEKEEKKRKKKEGEEEEEEEEEVLAQGEGREGLEVQGQAVVSKEW